MTKKLKILTVVSAVWIIVALAAALDMSSSYDGMLVQFLVFGVLPVVIAWGLVWIFGRDG